MLKRVHRLKCAKIALLDIITVKKRQKSIGKVEDANISTLASVILEKARVNKIDAKVKIKQMLPCKVYF